MHQLMTMTGILAGLAGTGAVLTGLAGVALLDSSGWGVPAGTIMIGGGVGLIVGIPALFIGLKLWADHDAAKERLL